MKKATIKVIDGKRIWINLTCMDCKKKIKDGEFANICLECFNKKLCEHRRRD